MHHHDVTAALCSRAATAGLLSVPLKDIQSSSFSSFCSGDVDLLKEECQTLKDQCQTLKEDNRRLSDRLQLLQRQRTW